jgi:hypothetical protein
MMSEGSSSGKRGGPEPKQEGPARRLRPDEIITPSHLNRVTRARARPSVANGTFSAMRAAATGGCVTQRRDPAIPAKSNQCSNLTKTLRRSSGHVSSESSADLSLAAEKDKINAHHSKVIFRTRTGGGNRPDGFGCGECPSLWSRL